jgi:hypothetical protein
MPWDQFRLEHTVQEDAFLGHNDSKKAWEKDHDNGHGKENHEMHSLSSNHLFQHDSHIGKGKGRIEGIVVRIEVSDTGCGIKPQDMVENKLFCECWRQFEFGIARFILDVAAFNQTEQGRQQGSFSIVFVSC